MASKKFQIQNYRVSMGYSMTLGGGEYRFRRVIDCQGTDGDRLIIYFQADGEELYAPYTSLAGKFGRYFVPVSEFTGYLDVLRNEQPLYGYINEERPAWNHLSTSDEPVGEAEG